MTPHDRSLGKEEIDKETLKRQIDLCSLIGSLLLRKLPVAQV